MNQTPRGRLFVIIAGLGAAALFVLGRLVTLQVAEHGEFERLAQGVQVVYQDVLPDRGRIFDRRGNLLAGNITDYRVGASPSLIADPEKAADKLAPLLSRPYDSLVADLKRKDARYVMLAVPVDGQTGQAIQDLNLTGIQLEPLARRVYPQAHLASHLLGFVGLDRQGYGGVEAFYQRELAGEPMLSPTRSDPLGQALGPLPQPGVDLILTLDRDAQYIVETTLAQALKDTGAKSGTIIVMDPRTGAILAMASLPDYDPNALPSSADEDIRRNPAVSDQYEPGSVFKILTMAIALNDSVVTPDTTYTDMGFIEIGGAVIRNWDGGTYGVQDMTGLLAHSLNVGAATVASWIGPEKFYAGLRTFGIGRPTGIDLANEASGYLRLPGDEDWHEADLATNSFGQGVAVTPIQLITAVAAVANHGVMMQPHVVGETVREGVHHPVTPRPVRDPPLGQVISAQAADQLKEMLAQAVEREVKLAQVPGYRIAGKTGTAQIARPGGFYDPDKTIASFVGFFPVDEPRVIILVKLDEPTSSPWGSLTAAPVFKTLAERLAVLLEIPPDEVRKVAEGVTGPPAPR